jgi:PKD repeat protein
MEALTMQTPTDSTTPGGSGRPGLGTCLCGLFFWMTLASTAPAQVVVDFSGTPLTGINPLSVSFTDMTTGGPVLFWTWDFGDGGSSSDQNPTHTYLAPGDYDVQLIVLVGTILYTGIKTDYITVDPVPLLADFSALPVDGSNPLVVAFTDLSTSSATITGWSWDFGDSNTSTLQNPVHTYTLPGTHSVSFTALVGLQADTLIKTDLITVAPAPLSVGFSASDTQGANTLPASFTDESTSPLTITAWSWDFGDGNGSSQQHPTHTYFDPGTYNVSLTAFLGQQSGTLVQSGFITVSDGIPQRLYVKSSNTEMFDLFGTSVALDGDTLVVGAPAEDSGATGANGDQGDNSISRSGAVYVFVRSGTGWVQQAYLKASNPGQDDYFGASVAISGETLVVSAYLEDSLAKGVNGDQLDNSANGAGAAYVFVRHGSSWTQQAYLKASNSGTSDYFGLSVAISDDTVVVGARYEDNSATGVDGNQSAGLSLNSGAAYVFHRQGATWSQQAYLKASNTDDSDNFGYAVTISGETVVVGAHGEDSSASGVDGDQSDEGAQNAGAAYVFVRNGSTWSQQAYLKASNSNGGDRFGNSLAMSDDTLVVGAFSEDGSASGVNGDQGDNNTSDAGAAYVFVRGEASWSQQAYLKASNTDASDLFGSGVALSGDKLIVGAFREDADSTGVNGDQTNADAKDAGSAYVFVRSGTEWSQQAYVKASNAGTSPLNEGDLFGTTVAVSGNTVAIGAPDEDSNATDLDGDQEDNSAPDAGAVYLLGPYTWGNLGGGTPGLHGQPQLVVSSPLTEGSELGIDLSDAPAGALMLLRASLTSTPLSVVGGTLYAHPYDLQLLFVADASGQFNLASLVGPGSPPGVEIYFQYIVQDLSVPFQITLSNARMATTP